MNTIVVCWDCKFDECHDEPHPWWDAEDLVYAEEQGLPLPEGNCACECGRGVHNEEDVLS